MEDKLHKKGKHKHEGKKKNPKEDLYASCIFPNHSRNP